MVHASKGNEAQGRRGRRVNQEGGAGIPGIHVSPRRETTYGARGCFCGGYRGGGPGWREASDLHVPKGAVSAAVVGRVARAGGLAVADVLLVGLVGDEVGTPAALVLDDGEGIAQGGTVVEAAAVALVVAPDWIGTHG